MERPTYLRLRLRDRRLSSMSAVDDDQLVVVVVVVVSRSRTFGGHFFQRQQKTMPRGFFGAFVFLLLCCGLAVVVW